jgi:hypothetical protein
MTKSRTALCVVLTDEWRSWFVQELAVLDKNRLLGECTMTRFATKTLLAAIALTALASATAAQGAAPTPWVLSPDTGYAYDKDGKTFSYKLGTNNAKDLLKGAKKVSKGTLFFIGENGQLYMRSGPYLEGDGKFKFGPG